MFMLWYVCIDSKYLASTTSSSTRTNANVLSWLLNIVTRHLRISRGGHLLLYGNRKGCQLAEHIATKVEVIPQMLSTLKKEKPIWSMNPGANFETSMVASMAILVALVNRQIRQGFYKLGRFVVRPFMSNFISIFISLAIKTWPNTWRKIWKRLCFDSEHKFGTTIFMFLWGLTFSVWFEDSLNSFECRTWELNMRNISRI